MTHVSSKDDCSPNFLLQNQEIGICKTYHWESTSRAEYSIAKLTFHNELTPTTEWVPLAQVESQAILSSTLLNHQTRSSVIQDLPKQNDKTFTFDLDSFRYRMGCTANEAIDGSIFDTITKAIQCFEPTMEKTVATGSSSGQNLSRSRMSWRSTNENLYSLYVLWLK